jgi:uncharacterized membrane protein
LGAIIGGGSIIIVGVKFPINTTAIAGVIVLGLAGYEYFSRKEYRIGPGVLLAIVVLLAARYAAQYQAKKRAAILKAVPKRPLGLDDQA